MKIRHVLSGLFLLWGVVMVVLIGYGMFHPPKAQVRMQFDPRPLQEMQRDFDDQNIKMRLFLLEQEQASERARQLGAR